MYYKALRLPQNCKTRRSANIKKISTGSQTSKHWA